MRSRVLAAALATAAFAAWGITPAFAQLKSVPVPQSYRVNSKTYVQNLGLGQNPGIGTSAQSYALFSSESEFGLNISGFAASGPNFAVQGTQARMPVFGVAGLSQPEVLTLRDISVSAAIMPGVRFEASRWSYASGTGMWDPRAAGAEQNLVRADTPLRSPYAPMGAEGFYVGAGVALTENLRLHVGRALSSPTPNLTAIDPLARDFAARLGASAHTIETTAAGIDWNFADWSGVGVTASQTRETTTVLGTSVPASLGATSAESAALGISARVGFGSGWVTTVAYNEGVTQLDLRQNGVLGNLDPVRTQTYGLAVAKHGLFGDDALGIAVSRPLNVYGTGNLTAALGATAVPENDFQVGYVTTFLDGALALQANAAYQMNTNGNEGSDSVSVLSRAKIRF